MRKKLMLLALVGLAFVLLAGPVMAAGSGRDTYPAAKQGPKRLAHVISMTGRIDAVNRSNRSISVTVQMTNKPYLVKRGQTVSVDTNTSTVYYLWSGKTRQRAGFGDLAVGQRVSINALVTDTTITARRVEVDKPRY